MPKRVTVTLTEKEAEATARRDYGLGEIMKTYTLDAKLPNGRYASDSGLTESEVAAARQNADRLGIEILSITEEVPVSPEDLNAFRNPQ